MREILFRGKDIKGNWHTGLLAHMGNAWYISNKAGIATAFEVIPSTIGEYTGLTDKNGKKIFEGDIVEHTQRYDISGVVTSIGVIKWSDSYGSWLVSNFSNGRADMFLANEKYRVKVIGNIHDNPELMKGGVENENNSKS